MILPILLALPDLPDEDRLLRRAQRATARPSLASTSFFEQSTRFALAGDDQLAEDLTSEVFVKFLTALQGDYAPRDTLRGWLFRVARNVLTDHYRGVPHQPAGRERSVALTAI